MKHMRFFLLLSSCLAFFTTPLQADILNHVVCTMGSGGEGRVIPMAAAPFGMVELGPDTYFSGSGYHYTHTATFGFSHTHKSGGGGTDFQDILFLPLTGNKWSNIDQLPAEITATFSHTDEIAQPGYYRLLLKDFHINAELTATPRCGMHRYSYPDPSSRFLLVNLKTGSENSTTIYDDENFDTVHYSSLEWVDQRTIRGCRISNGWCPEQHVYFYARFSQPIQTFRLFSHLHLQQEQRFAEGTDIRALLSFASSSRPIEIAVGISPVSMNGARLNLQKEIGHRSFDAVRKATQQSWRRQLSVLQIEGDSDLTKTFYSCLYFAQLYPQLYSDVDGSYRSSDKQIYQGKRRYFAGVLGLWDTFRAQDPLIALLHPDITRDLMQTFLEHFRHCGQLPIWTLAGQENMCMIGYHSMPVIADAYAKGIRTGYDVRALYDAMKISANRDTFGFFLKDYRGARLYKHYHYCPCDSEITSVSKTLEYAYDDWCIAQMARMLGHSEDYHAYLKRAAFYRNVFDPSTMFMRGRQANGSWRTPFDPFLSNHYHEGDDFCEGDAWQWTFFVPHDGKGLIHLFGSRQRFVSKLDSLFITSSELHGAHISGDITGLIGQYAHGNEPSHSTIYMYNYAGEPWKAQHLISQVAHTLYNTSPDGFCGNDDTGQMSSWFIFSAMGFYPVTHGTAIYFFGAPQLRKVLLHHAHGTLTILAPQASRTNCYIQGVTLNGKPYSKSWIRHDELFHGNVTLRFDMSSQPNKQWGSSTADLPPSMTDEEISQ